MTTINWSLAATIFMLAFHSNSYGTPLDDYVYAPDDHYSFKEIESFRGSDYTVYIYNMTSQKWKDESILNHPVWWHYLTITIPDKVVFDSAFLFIAGGYNDDRAPSMTDTYVAFTATFASGTGAIAAELRMIPNQPIVFKADPEKKERVEDAIIAWTWKTFILTNSSDPEFLLRMPMTKRGWTTWTTGAVDKRVIAIAPIVLDLLNMVKNEPLPKMEWIKALTPNGGKIILTLDRQPMTIQAYHAQTLDGRRRDFRLYIGTPGNPRTPQVNPVMWLTHGVTFLVTFPSLMGSVLEFTTQTMIIPNTFPFEDCHGETCYGELV